MVWGFVINRDGIEPYLVIAKGEIMIYQDALDELKNACAEQLTYDNPFPKHDHSGAIQCLQDLISNVENHRMVVPTSAGCFVVDNFDDPDYPGVDVEFVPNEGKKTVSLPRVLFEYNENYGELRALAWNDSSKEDYTKEVVFWHGV